ncbi:MAG: chorismate-binding protein, partial [Acidobacteria bacterium]|nr:chorismate-binding protein [Acidobacteriota bacterium]
MIYPDIDKFKEDAAHYAVIPVSKEIRADFETPLSIYLKCRGLFLLESIERGEHVGRYSFIACGKKSEIVIRGHNVAISEKNGEMHSVLEKESENPLNEVRDYFRRLQSPEYEHLPPFYGGAIGYLGYEAVQYFENIPVFTGDTPVPDAMMVIPEMLLVYDSVKRTIFLIAAAFTKNGGESEYEEACRQITVYEEQLSQTLSTSETVPQRKRMRMESEISREHFLQGVETCKQYIRDGEIIQAVLSQRFTTEIETDPFTVYQALRIINPSPYLFFLDFDDFVLIGSSPEVMVKVQNRELLIKPIAGTRPRGDSLSEDDRLSKELLADAKEKAEHLMLVDLA